MREDTIFRLYSMTKPITSIAFMTLIESGIVSLNDPVHSLIPGWTGLTADETGCANASRPRAHRPMLIVDLLRHTSGLAYGFGLSSELDIGYRKRYRAGKEGAVTMEQIINQLARLPLEFWPGEAWSYSISTDIVGYLIEKLTGQPLARFLRDRIFGPLRMPDTDFYVPADKSARLAACYATPPAMTLLDDPLTSAYLEEPSLCSGGGGLVSTAADYMRFCRMLLNGGTLDGARILRSETIAMMTSNQLPDGKDLPSISRTMYTDASFRGVGFGLGFALTIDSAKVPFRAGTGDYSWGGAASTYFWVDPHEDLVAIFMTQLTPSSAYPIRRDVRELVYAALIDPDRRSELGGRKSVGSFHHS